MKAIIYHRTCRTCRWWQKNRPCQQVRKHRCVLNHIESARMMESVSGVEAIRQLKEDGIPIDVMEGDGDNTLVARLKAEGYGEIKKKYDRNHMVKNIGKQLHELAAKKHVKLSKMTLVHLKNCISYAISKNQGDPKSMEVNLRAIVPHNFSDHSICHPRFCGYIRNSKSNKLYKHKSLPYGRPLSDGVIRDALDAVMCPVILKTEILADLGSSQQCEHAN